MIRATFNNEGFATGFYPSDIWPEGYPVNSVEITQGQWRELLEFQSTRRFVNGEVVACAPSAVDPVTVLYPIDLWSRLTDAEADAVEAAMATQPVRIQNIFRSANSYRSDHELWPLLVSMATNLFGSERAAEILAAS